MARKIVAIHGIGHAKPGWSELLRLDLGIPESDWIEFCYDDLMEENTVNRLVVIATKVYLSHAYGPEAAALAGIAEEYLDDLLAYFIGQSTRLAIQVRLKGILDTHPDALILAHSLGSVVAYETLRNFDLKAHSLFTLGSPLSKTLVCKFLKVPAKSRPAVSHWFNVWSRLDPISGKVKELGCLPEEQFPIKNSHDLLRYVHSQRERILRLYQDNGS